MATITVTNLSDNDPGSLRQALLNANSGDTINFAPGLAGGTLTLTTGELDITKNLTVDGFIDAAGTPLITIDANHDSRVFYVADGTKANPISATLNALTIEGGYVAGASSGGGIQVGSYDSLIVGDSRLTGNQGGIWVGVNSTLTLLRSTIDHNSDTFGGGIDAFHASVNVVDSTLSGNSAKFGGGGINADFSTLTLDNATLAGNSADGGSGINESFTTLALYDSTVTGNAPGAILGSNLTLSNSIVAGNGDEDFVTGTPLVLKGNNILGSTPFVSIDTTNGTFTQIDGTSQAALLTVFAQVGDNPDTGVLSGVLAENGGPIETVAINPASIAHDAGSNAALPPDTFDLNNNGNTAEPLPVDARGAPRVSDGTVDIGAFEAQQSIPFDLNGDANSDLVFQNNGAPGIWLWNGAGPTAEIGYANPGASWHIITSRDLNGDGNADLIWQNSDGTPGIWLMNGTTPIAEAGIANPGASWRIVASGDTNRDGKADLIWQNTDGTLGVWLMNGTTSTAEAAIGSPGPNWKVIGAADFNADSRDDILLQNTATGNLMIDLMNGTSITSSVSITVGDPSWHAVSVGEFNGQAEIAWQNSNGTPGLWLMNGTAPAAEVGLPNAGVGWQLVSIDHFTPNGQADLLFQNTSGAMGMWETNGASIATAFNLPNPGAGWQSVNGHPFAT